MQSISNRQSAIQNRLSLTLLMLGVDANHSYYTFAVNDFALITHFFYRRPDFHLINPQSSSLFRNSYYL